jgi:hypothetical protein
MSLVIEDEGIAGPAISSSSTAITTTNANKPTPMVIATPLSIQQENFDVGTMRADQLQELGKKNKEKLETWNISRLKTDLLYRVFNQPHSCQELYEYVMRFLWERFGQDLPKELEIFDLVFETERGKSNPRRPKRPMEAAEKIMLFLCITQRFRELSTIIVKESGMGADGFFNRQSENSPKNSIVHWLFGQSFNPINVHDILEIATQFAFMDYLQKGLPFNLVAELNPREQLREYFIHRVPNSDTNAFPTVDDVLK